MTNSASVNPDKSGINVITKLLDQWLYELKEVVKGLEDIMNVLGVSSPDNKVSKIRRINHRVNVTESRDKPSPLVVELSDRLIRIEY